MSVSSSEARFQPGALVRLRASGRRGIVHRVERAGDVWTYDVLFFGNDTLEVYAEAYLAPDEEDDSVLGLLKNWHFLDPDGFRQALTVLKLRRPLQQNLYSYLASRTDLQPYQFKPVLKLLQSPYGRLYIADEVGLGKTIEAGIIMTELAARGSMARVLVCCPPALRLKWRAEMLERFDVDFQVLTSTREVEGLLGGDRAADPCRIISSLHLLRSEPILERLAASEVRFDLVIVDESHHMQNPETVSHRLGEQLSAAADHMLMLSATPLSLTTANLFHQLSILVPEEFFDPAEFDARIVPNAYLNQAIRLLRKRPPAPQQARAELEKAALFDSTGRLAESPLFQEVCDGLGAGRPLDAETTLTLQTRINELNTIGHVFTRTRKREVQEHFPARRAHVIRVSLSDAEREFYDAVTEFVRSRAGGQVANFATIMPQRQVASSIPAAREYLRERWSRATRVEEETAGELELAVDEGDVLPLLDATGRLRQAWEAAAGVDSKFERFREALEQMIEEGTAAEGKVLVFSFFRKTLEHLLERLRGAEVAGKPLRVSLLYGPTPEEERHRLVRAFREEPGPHVLLSSEVAAEGLDFEFANALVNYDLPWNPMRVEQRIGRLDRYGQQAGVVHIFNFSVADTIEERILERLYERIGIFEAAIGDLESILGDAIEQLTRDLLQPGRTPEEEEEIIAQAAENILRRKADFERFEQESQNLLGQDDIFTEQLHRLEHEQRYVGPEEVRNFVEVALRETHPRVKLADEPDGTTVIHYPTPGDGLSDLIASHLRQSGERNSRAWRAVALASAPDAWRVTFSPDVAKRRRELEFITLHHPLVGALLAEQPEVVRPTAALAVHGVERNAQLVFFLFLLRVQSFRQGLEFLPVAVELGGEVDEEVSARLLLLVQRATAWTPESPYAAEEQLDDAWAKALAWVVGRVDERRAELARVSDAILDRRIESLRDSHARWRIRRLNLLADAEEKGQQSIARLHRGYLRRRDAEVDAKVTELERMKGVEIGHELLGGGLLLLHTGDGKGPT
jgi:superfamily II DNA or RNA helicase